MSKKKIAGVIVGIIVIIGILSFTFYSALDKSNDINTTESEMSKKLEEIRNREEVKRQQELIVQRTYRYEMKSRLEEEIIDNDKNIESIEGELLSLYQALTLDESQVQSSK